MSCSKTKGKAQITFVDQKVMTSKLITVMKLPKLNVTTGVIGESLGTQVKKSIFSLVSKICNLTLVNNIKLW